MTVVQILCLYFVGIVAVKLHLLLVGFYIVSIINESITHLSNFGFCLLVCFFFNFFFKFFLALTTECDTEVDEQYRYYNSNRDNTDSYHHNNSLLFFSKSVCSTLRPDKRAYFPHSDQSILQCMSVSSM